MTHPPSEDRGYVVQTKRRLDAGVRSIESGSTRLRHLLGSRQSHADVAGVEPHHDQVALTRLESIRSEHARRTLTARVLDVETHAATIENLAIPIMAERIVHRRVRILERIVARIRASTRGQEEDRTLTHEDRRLTHTRRGRIREVVTFSPRHHHFGNSILRYEHVQMSPVHCR